MVIAELTLLLPLLSFSKAITMKYNNKEYSYFAFFLHNNLLYAIIKWVFHDCNIDAL